MSEPINFCKTVGFMSREWDFDKIKQVLDSDIGLKEKWCSECGITMDDERAVFDWPYDFQKFYNGYFWGNNEALLSAREDNNRLREEAMEALSAHGSPDEHDAFQRLNSIIFSPSLAPAKTCRWIYGMGEDCEMYDTSCGDTASGEFTVQEMLYKFCPYCGLPIEVTEEETT
jgi:hypothetical protein